MSSGKAIPTRYVNAPDGTPPGITGGCCHDAKKSYSRIASGKCSDTSGHTPAKPIQVATNICVRANAPSDAAFELPVETTAVRLVHRSGSTTCNCGCGPPCTSECVYTRRSKWGCGENDNVIGIMLAKDGRIVSPKRPYCTAVGSGGTIGVTECTANSDCDGSESGKGVCETNANANLWNGWDGSVGDNYLWWKPSGVNHPNSPELILTSGQNVAFSPGTYRVVFGEAWAGTDANKGDNWGQTCFDVYAHVPFASCSAVQQCMCEDSGASDEPAWGRAFTMEMKKVVCE